MSRLNTIKNSILLFVAELINLFSGIFIIVFIARFLDVESLGFFSYSYSIGAVLLILTLYGLKEQIIRALTTDFNLINYYFINVLFLRFLLLVLFLLCAYIFASYVDYSLKFKMIFILLLFARNIESFVFMYCGFFRAADDFKYELFVRVILNVINTIISLIIIYNLRSLLFFAIWQAGYYFSFLFFILFFMKIKYKLRLIYAVNFKTLFSILYDGKYFFLITLFLVGLIHLNTIILQIMSGNASVGIYTAAFRFISALGMISMAISGALFPALTKTLKEKSRKNADILFITYLKFSLIFGAFISVALFLNGNYIINLFYGNSYKASVLCLQIIAPTVIFVFMNSIASYYMMALHKEKVYLLYVSIILIVTLVANFILIYFLQYIGASITTVFPEFAAFILMLGFFRYIILKKDFIICAIKVFIIVTAIVFLFKNFMYFDSIGSFMFFNLLLIITYVILLLAFKLFDFKQIKNMFLIRYLKNKR